VARDVAELLDILDLDAVGADRFVGVGPAGRRQRVFGGLVVAQALVAASRTVAERAPHSLHAYFVLPGDPTEPITYHVERVRDGRSFTTRRCVAWQSGRAIFDLFASFQVVEDGLDHQASMPPAPDPDSLPSLRESAARDPDSLPEALKVWFDAERSIDVRPCDLARYRVDAVPCAQQRVWIRASAPLPDDPAVHRAVLAYLSDLTLVDVALAAHGHSLFQPQFAVASLDHALWFHRPFRADDWFLYDCTSPSASGSRGLASGRMYTEDGVHIASAVQEGLLRRVGERK
jgi:acyl-CoA thioesterase II